MNHVENGTPWFSVYISRPFPRTTASDISLDALRKAECHKLENGGDVNTVFVHALYDTHVIGNSCAHVRSDSMKEKIMLENYAATIEKPQIFALLANSSGTSQCIF